MTFGSVFGRVFSPTFQPSSQAASAAGSWWDLNGTITSCVAAYQAKGAASYAASKTNLANPGTLGLLEGAGYPSWSVDNGWEYANVLSANYLYLPADTTIRTVVIKVYFNYNHYTSCFGQLKQHLTDGQHIRADSSSTLTGTSSSYVFHYGGHLYVNNTETTAYTNQAWMTIISEASGNVTKTFSLGYSSTQYNRNMNGYIGAIATYDDVLSSEQRAALTTAMNAL